MTQGFDGKGKYLKFYNAEFGVAKYCTKSWGLASFEAGQQSRQAEIDELKNNLDFSENCVVDARHERDELQKRIDEAVSAMEQSKPLMMRQYDAMQALNILKGKKDE